MLLVGLPVLGLLGILETGRGIAAPPAISGEWNVQIDSAHDCAIDAWVRQPAMSITQSGTQALITLNYGTGTVLPATIQGSSLSATALTATVSGKPGERVLTGRIQLGACAPLAFHAVRRRSPKRQGE
jgi:hypothetical protein